MQNDIKEGIKEFSKLIKKYPDIQELYIGRAILYSKIKEYEKALKDYERGCMNYICYDIIAICRRNALIKEAEGIYTRRIEKDSKDIMNYISRARFYISIGENKKALADCEKVLSISPENEFVLGIKEGLEKQLKARPIRNINRSIKIYR